MIHMALLLNRHKPKRRAIKGCLRERCFAIIVFLVVYIVLRTISTIVLRLVFSHNTLPSRFICYPLSVLHSSLMDRIPLAPSTLPRDVFRTLYVYHRHGASMHSRDKGIRNAELGFDIGGTSINKGSGVDYK